MFADKSVNAVERHVVNDSTRIRSGRSTGWDLCSCCHQFRVTGYQLILLFSKPKWRILV